MKKQLKKAAAVVSAVAMAGAFAFLADIGNADHRFGSSVSVSAESVGDFNVIGGTSGTDYTYENNELTVKTDVPLTISGTTTSDRITVADGVNANITLDNVNINASRWDDTAAFDIAADSKGNVTITLVGYNTLKGGSNCAGITKNSWGNDAGTLTITGTGSLTAIGGSNAAGIGGGYNGNGSNIVINGGTVTATGNDGGAGIGGGHNGDGSNIVINGGTVIAEGGVYSEYYDSCGVYEGGAGIGGGGKYGSGSNIVISGGIVTAKGGVSNFDTYGANYYYGGAGIGGGSWGKASDIIISGGSVKAIAGENSNAVGGGKGYDAVIPTNGTENVYLLTIENPDGEYVWIDDEKYIPENHASADSSDTNLYVYLTGTDHIVEVGNNEYLYGFDTSTNTFAEKIYGTAFTVTGSDLIYGTDYTYPVKTGVLTIMSEKAITISNAEAGTTTDRIVVADGVNANITLDNVNIDVSTLDSTAAFKIADNSKGNVTITLVGDNTLKGGSGYAGITKSGSADDVGTLTITGTGSLTAVGGSNAAGIGGRYENTASNITISGGIVTATGNGGGAGIGGGYNGSGSNIVISGGQVNAEGGVKSIFDQGLSIYYGGAGIGGGYNGSGSNIVISGGIVTAKGGVSHDGSSNWYFGGAGIGGGGWADASDIIISGGSVKAIAGKDANAVGGGYCCDAVIPTNGTENVYLLTIENPDGEYVWIDDEKYIPENHASADSSDTNLYVYLTGTDHIVEIGDNEYLYGFDTSTNTFAEKIYGTAFTVTGSDLIYGTDYTYPAKTGVLTIMSEKAITISNAEAGTTTDCIVVEDGVNANITLDNVNIDAEDAAFTIANNSTGNVTITLADGSNNVLKSGNSYAGLEKNHFDDDAVVGTLTITGTGSLTAIGGGYAAGIGSGFGCSTKNITISGGTIIAKGGEYGAGIGGGCLYSSSDITKASNITISGGTVTAKGGEYGAGIGGGGWVDASDIIISGGSVKAIAGIDANAVGGGTDYGAVIPTNGTENVYLLEISNPTNENITINGKAYPTNHNGEANVYVYAPAGTIASPNTVTVGEKTSYCYYDKENKKWINAIGVEIGSDKVIVKYTEMGNDEVMAEEYAFNEVTEELVKYMKSKDIGLVIDFVNSFTAVSDNDLILTDAQFDAIVYVLEHDNIAA